MVTSELTPSLIGQKKNRHVFRVELVERLEMSIKDTGYIPWLSSQCDYSISLSLCIIHRLDQQKSRSSYNTSKHSLSSGYQGNSFSHYA